MKRTHLYPLLALAIATPTMLYAASQTNRNMPFVVEADRATYNDVQQTSTFDGTVILKQGNMTVESAHIETIIDPEGYQYATAKGGAKGLVHFRQQREGSNEWLDAYGSELIYDGKQNLILLRRNAIMRRLTPAGKLIDEVKGDELVYNQLTEVFESRVVPGVSGRTQVTITPTSNATK